MKDCVIPHNRRSHFQDWSGLSGENLRRHILVMSQGVNALGTTPSALPADSPPSHNAHFKV